MKVSWLLATHYRPRLLAAVLETIADSTYPAGWDHEVVVAHHEGDHGGAVIAATLGAVVVSSRHASGGGKRNAALRACTGELVLLADDDDCPSPRRAAAAISAFSRGHGISEIRAFRYLHMDTGQVVRWDGRGGLRPGVVVGTARNYRRTLLTKVSGWRPLPCLIEKDIHVRLRKKFPGKESRAADLSNEDLAESTICIQHQDNVWSDRPSLPRGRQLWRGDYLLTGEGHWSEAPRFPNIVADRLGLT